MADSLAPVDESVKVPAAVTRAAQAAEAFYQTEPEKPAEEAAPEPAPASASAPVQPDPDPQPPADPPTPEPNWEHRYRSMEGRFRQVSEVNATLSHQLQQFSNAASQQRTFAQPLVTDEERKAYGDDLLSVVERKALEAVNPHLSRLQAENERLRQRVARDEARDVWSVLSYEVPNWREINVSAEFLGWLALPDIYSGQLRNGMLKVAFDSGDANRVLAFFRGFLAEHPEFQVQVSVDPQEAPAAEAPKRQAAVNLRDIAAPGKARPAPGNAPQSAEPIVITNKDIDRFYEAVRQGKYAGRAEQKDADEARIMAAVREGRVRRIK